MYWDRYMTTVVVDWHVSVETGSLIDGARVSAFRREPHDDWSVANRRTGSVDGREFPNSDDANRYLFEHGYVVRWFRRSPKYKPWSSYPTLYPRRWRRYLEQRGELSRRFRVVKVTDACWAVVDTMGFYEIQHFEHRWQAIDTCRECNAQETRSCG